MKKLLLSILFISGLGANAQVTVFEDSFETYTNFAISGFGGWQTIDVDLLNTYVGGNDTPDWNASWTNAGLPQAFMVFNPSAALGTLPGGGTAGITNATDGVAGATENRNFDPKTGSKYAACWASSLTGGSPVNNDWLVSPVINLGASNNELKFWVKSMSDSYGLEKYRVGVYVGTGTPTPADFTIISGIPSLTAPYPNWEEKTFALNTYSNQSIRIGIRCQTPDAYMFMVDDFRVTSSNLRTDEFLSGKFTTYPNPSNNVVTITNTDNILLSEVSISDVNGRIIKNLKVDNLSETQINVSDINSGIYFMNITTDEGIVVKKFIKN